MEKKVFCSFLKPFIGSSAEFDAATKSVSNNELRSGVEHCDVAPPATDVTTFTYSVTFLPTQHSSFPKKGLQHGSDTHSDEKGSEKQESLGKVLNVIFPLILLFTKL